MKSVKMNSWMIPVLALLSVAVVQPAVAKSTQDKIKESIDNIAASLKKDVDKLGDDMSKVQNYLENYHWKGLIQDKASSGAETLSNLRLNNHRRVIVAHPCEKIEGKIDLFLDANKAAALSVYRVVLGYKGVGPQTTIGTTLGISSGASHEHFSLIAPAQPGVYEVRFRTADNFMESKAMEAWYDERGNEPDGTTTIGIVYVK